MAKSARKPRRGLYEILKSQGLQMNSLVILFSDRGDRVREVPRYLSPESKHWLEWFHITTHHYCDGRDGEGCGRSLGSPGMKVTDGSQAHQQRSCWWAWWWAIGAQ